MSNAKRIKRVVKIINVRHNESDFAYWQAQPIRARLAALEEIRREYHRWKYGTEQRFERVVTIANANKVRYLVVGGYAVAAHGHPRYTEDLDVWIDRTPTNAKKLIKALEQFGFSSLGLEEKDFLKPDQIIQLGVPPARVEIFAALKGVDFKKCYPLRLEARLMTRGWTFDLKNLKKNKKAVGRLQDLADLENLD